MIDIDDDEIFETETLTVPKCNHEWVKRWLPDGSLQAVCLNCDTHKHVKFPAVELDFNHVFGHLKDEMALEEELERKDTNLVYVDFRGEFE